jgi:hypothetical protein
MSELNAKPSKYYYDHFLGGVTKGYVLQMLVDRDVGSEVTAQNLKDIADVDLSTVTIFEQLRVHLSGMGMVERVSQGSSSSNAVYRTMESPLWEGAGVLLGNIADLSQVDASAEERPPQS